MIIVPARRCRLVAASLVAALGTLGLAACGDSDSELVAATARSVSSTPGS